MNKCVLHIYMPEAEQRQQHKEGGGLRASGEAKKASSSPPPPHPSTHFLCIYYMPGTVLWTQCGQAGHGPALLGLTF